MDRSRRRGDRAAASRGNGRCGAACSRGAVGRPGTRQRAQSALGQGATRHGLPPGRAAKALVGLPDKDPRHRCLHAMREDSRRACQGNLPRTSPRKFRYRKSRSIATSGLSAGGMA
jgi:hypothetical protein